MTKAEDFTKDELYSLAQNADVSGYSDLTKKQLFQLLDDEAPHMLDPFQAVSHLAVGDTVQMNHLASDLTVTELRRYTEDDEVIQQFEDDREVRELPDDRDISPHTVVIMETNRGGRHALVAQKEGDAIPTPQKNGADPHLRRWRAGDKEWMNNSTDPLFIKQVDEEDDDDES